MAFHRKTRTPRNYRGTKNPAKKIEDLLPQVLKEVSLKAKIPNDEIYRFWREILGESMAKLTEPISFQDEVLTVKVKSSTLYSLLVTHEKRRLLAKLKTKFSIRNIRFRMG